jgi:acetyltransferase-like isoleucine patch superfamily enzyme
MFKIVGIISWVIRKIMRVLFSFVYSLFFKSIGRNSIIFRPFRIDGNQFIRIGSNTIIQKRGWIYCVPVNSKIANLTIGNNCAFGYNNHITAVKKVIIGDYVLTANNVYISDNLHSYKNISVPILLQGVEFKSSVIIGDGCWIGENVCIVGASIGKNCVIGANSVVTKDIPDYSVAVGTPAKVIKFYDQNLKCWVKVKN